MQIVQVSPTHGERCGVGIFGATLEKYLCLRGYDVLTLRDLSDFDCDLLLVQHQWSLYDDRKLSAFLGRIQHPTVFIAHSGGVEKYDGLVTAFASMGPRMIGDTKSPVVYGRVPAFVPSRLSARDELRRSLDLPLDRTILGTSGFMLESRQFEAVLELLLPSVSASNAFVYLVCTPWMRDSPRVRKQLLAFEREFSNCFQFNREFLSPQGLNLRLQACDLLWCWTGRKSRPYSSGALADQYGSGTRIFASDREQHAPFLSLPNVITGASELNGFVTGLLAEMAQVRDANASGRVMRHDPSPVAWGEFMDVFCGLFRGIASGA